MLYEVITVDVGRFLLNRLSRDMRTLLATLNRLDKASIAAQEQEAKEKERQAKQSYNFV